MSSSDVAIKSMDLARSITDILGKGGAVSGLVGETMKWLAREKIDEADFTYCLNKTRALLYPNSKGLEIQSSLREADEKLRRNPFVAGLSLLGAGSIGRWMAQSPEYCYLATTVATLLIHHDMSYAANAICEMVLFEHQKVDDIISVKNDALRRSQLRPVVSKIVDSITLNVVNCGHDLGSLPPQLNDICGHTCDAHAFAEVTMTVARGTGNFIVRCTNFPVDIFVWALAHLDSSVELSIAGQIIYRDDSRGSQKSLLFLVDEDCSCSKQHRPVLGQHGRNSITVSTITECDLRIIMESNAHLQKACGKRSFTRQALYNLGSSTGCSLGTLLPSEMSGILQASQNIILWVLGRPASPLAIGDDRQHINCFIPLGDLFSRWPRICNGSFGGSRTPAILSSQNMSKGSQSYLDILSHFQETRTILERCEARCSCPPCSQKINRPSQLRARFGCLRSLARSTILRLIAHAIADGFGADDVSGVTRDRTARDVETATSGLLKCLLAEEEVVWATWFGIAASVYLGCPMFRLSSQGTNSEPVAVQFGSSVVAASWIDLCNEIKLTGCYGFESAQGCLRNVDADLALLCTERTACSSFRDIDLSDAKLPQHDYDEIDNTELSLHSTIHPTRDYTNIDGGEVGFFKLVTIAKVRRHTRIINPAAILVAIALSVVPRCTHKDSTKNAVIPSSPHKIWSFQEALGFWEVDNFEDRSASWVYHTTFLDTNAKVNTLLALSPQGCIVRTADCCFACAQKELDTLFLNSKARRVLSIAIDEDRLFRQ